MEGNKDMTLEQAFEQLDSIIRKMDSKDIPLEEAFKLYREGTSLLEFANGSIDKVEKEIIRLRGEYEDGK